MPTPKPIATPAARIWPASFHQLLRSILSSTKPIITKINPPKKIPEIAFVIPIVKSAATAKARKIGTPPALGIIFLCKIAGCLCFFGLSTKLYFFA
ncbi:hypothetical protein A2470_00640 [Candidatus Curtissbacteria bacterium RIFOXYC2_FULL_41_11]|nr:MAG: hypothetical protein A2470_00640 [Candidatus Curtissbacteria bacterium RIFOXYC2_FULL_41_11]